MPDSFLGVREEDPKHSMVCGVGRPQALDGLEREAIPKKLAVEETGRETQKPTLGGHVLLVMKYGYCPEGNGTPKQQRRPRWHPAGRAPRWLPPSGWFLLAVRSCF